MDHCVTPETVARTLEEHPDVKAVYIVSPTYYGVCRRPGVDRTHRARGRQAAARGRSLGAALPLPPGAAALGDGGRRRPVHQLDAQDALGVLAVRDAPPERRPRAARPPQGGAQDVSLDLAEFADGRLARRRAQADGDRGRGAAVAHDRRWRTRRARRINAIGGLYCFGDELQGRHGVFDLDPTKIAVTRQGLGYTGYEASEAAAPPVQHSSRTGGSVQRRRARSRSEPRATPPTGLVSALEEMARDDRPLDMYAPSGILEQPAQPRQLSPAADSADAHAARATLSWPRPNSCRSAISAGRICAETISPYPPGIPVISPGEEITAGDRGLLAPGD